MDIQQALYNLGVRDDTLSADEKTFLDENGYLPLINLLPSEQTQALADRLELLAKEEGEKAGKEFKQEPGTIRLSNLADKGQLFEICFTHPKVLAAIAHVLAYDFKLSSLNGRFALPGYGHQPLHVDWHHAAAGDGDYQVCNSIWLMDDFTADNGATRVVPGTNRSEYNPQEVLDDPLADHPDQVQLIAPAGSVVIFNAHTWHGGTLNHTKANRRAMHSYFCRRHNPQQVDQRKFVSRESADRLSLEARVILDVA